MSAKISAFPPRGQVLTDLRLEADHRIANSLTMIGSLVRVMATKGDLSDPKAILMEVADRIHTVGSLHRALAASGSDTVRLFDQLREICDRLSASIAQRSPRVALTCSPEIVVRSRVALPISLIIAELFSNSLKYAHPATEAVKISITCDLDESGELSIAYEDDGVGFPEDFDFSHDGHMGVGLIRSLCLQLNATHEWTSDALGMSFEMVVPSVP